MVKFRCHGCGAEIDPGTRLAFACPNAGAPDDDVDHVLVVADEAAAPPIGNEQDPFLRYRAWLSPYRLARSAGLSDAAWIDLVGRLDEALAKVDGHGFRVTPMTERPRLADGIGLAGRLWVKDETGNVSGSHKARHLMGVMLYLGVLQAAGLPAGDGLRSRRLAIASCGNAALAAAVVARAADWPLDVFIPPDAEEAVKTRLKELGANVAIADRQAGEAGDPCYLRFREAVAAGAIPFGVQGPDNGLAIEGGRTLAFEMAEEFARIGQVPDALFVQVGGGALASALAQGLALARANGLLPSLPKLFAVQTAGCAPLARAWQRLGDAELDAAAKTKSRFMWTWETMPQSLAHGILDDETYDWWAIAQGMRVSGGDTVVVDEAEVAAAHAAGRTCTDINASATGTSGLAGVIARPTVGPTARSTIAVIFSGVER